jgi:hypothetical protein
MASGGHSRGGFCVVFFVDTGASLKDAQGWLSAAGLMVEASYPEFLHARLRGQAGVNVGVSRGPKAQDQIRALAARVPHLGPLNEVSAFFHLTFKDLDEVLEQADTLERVQRALQDGVRGILYEPWNQGGSAPSDSA